MSVNYNNYNCVIQRAIISLNYSNISNIVTNEFFQKKKNKTK